MKKIILACGIAAAALGFTACNGGGGASSSSSAQGDSLSILLGQVQGGSYLGMWDQMLQQTPDSLKQNIDKDKFLEGFKAVMGKDPKTDQSYMLGMQVAMQVMGNVAQLQDAGVAFDKAKYISNFCSAFKADSVDQAELQKAQEALTQYMNVANEAIMAKQRADQQRAEQDRLREAQPQIEAGKKYIEDLKKKDPAYKTTESGLTYKAEKEGTGAKPADADKVKVRYVGKHIDGTVFDQTKDEPAEFSLRGVVPGFAEVLKLMAPGAKYTAVLPYEIAYGVNGNRDIKPGETLIFEIEMVGVTPGPKPATPAK